MTDANGDAFEVLQRFAGVWHDKYAKSTGAGENRKPPSLTMRANGGAAVLTEPQLQAAVAGCERTLREMQAERNAANAELERLRDDNDALIKSCRRWMEQATVDFDRARDAGMELERIQAQAAVDVRTADATLKAWAMADRTKLSDALIDLREVFIRRIAEAEVRERHALEDARKVGGNDA